MTTAEPPEPSALLHPDFIINKQNLQEIGGLAARQFGVHWCPFVVPYQSFWLRLDHSGHLLSQFASGRKKASSVMCHLHFHPAYARFLVLHHRCHHIHFK